MTAEKYLQSIRDLNYKIQMYEDMKRETRIALESIIAITPDADKVQTSYSGGLERRIAKSWGKIKEIDSWILACQTKQLSRKQKAYQIIDQIEEGQCKRFLIDYYINGKSEKQISREYMYTNDKSIYKIKKRAVDAFETVYNKS